MLIAYGLAIWMAISVPVSLVVGAVINVGNGQAAKGGEHVGL